VSRNSSSHRRHRRHGFTLVELMVVIAIVAIVSWIGFGLIGVLRGTDPLEGAATLIRATVTQGRSQAVASGSSFTLLVDWEGNRLVPVTQRSVATFSFESAMGSFGRFMALGGGAVITNKRADGTVDAPRYSGECLDLPTTATVRIPFGNEFSRRSGVDGMAVRFRIFPMPYGSSSGVLMSSGGSNVWRLDLNTNAAGDSIVVASVPGTTLESEVPLAPYAWGEVELVYSPVIVQLSVNGIPSSAPATYDPAGIESHAPEIMIGGSGLTHLLMDELRLDSVQMSAPVSLGSALLLPPLVDGNRMATGGSPWGSTVGEDGSLVIQMPPLPIAPAASYDPAFGIPRRGLVVFDARGQLDTALHTGQVSLEIVALYPDGQVRQIQVGITPLGSVTSQLVPLRRLSSFDTPLEELPTE